MAQDYNDIYSIVERLRVLEEGLDKNQKSVNQLGATFRPKTVAVLTAKKDPKNPLAGKLVGGCEESEETDEEPLEEAVTSEDVLSKVQKSLADYLKNVADEIKQDSDLKDKKKDDRDLRKKEINDRDLIAKEVNEDHRKLAVGDRVAVTGPNHYEGEFGEIAEFAPSGKFVVVRFDNGEEASMHLSDVEFHDDQEDVEDFEDDWYDEELEEMTDDEAAKLRADAEAYTTKQMTAPKKAEPKKSFMQKVGDRQIGMVKGAIKGLTNPDSMNEDPTEEEPATDAVSSVPSTNPTLPESAPVKTVANECGIWEVHGDMGRGFEIRNSGRAMQSRFKSLDEAVMALEMFASRRAKQQLAGDSADYVEEK
jgi:hypothetical protein